MKAEKQKEEVMKLTPQQIEHFNREGWLFLPELFSREETDFLA
jgi:ectoine hydroxylase